MKTICIAGKNNIAVDLLLHCMKFYPNCRLVCIANKNDCGINNWQKSLKFFAKKNDVEILQLQDVYTLSDLLFLSCEFDSIIKPENSEAMSCTTYTSLCYLNTSDVIHLYYQFCGVIFLLELLFIKLDLE